IGCHSCDKAWSRKMVDVFKGKILNFIKNIVPQIRSVSRTCFSGEFSSECAKQKREHCENRKKNAVYNDIVQIVSLNTDIDDISHEKRDENFHEYFEGNEYRCKNGLLFVFSNGFEKQ